MTTEKERLKRKTADLKTENDKLNHLVKALTQEQNSLKQERAQLQGERGVLEELCTNLEKENQHLTEKLKKLESAQKNLENTNNQLQQALENASAQLAQAKEKIAIEKTELEREIARLKSLEGMEAKSGPGLTQQAFSERKPGFKTPKPKIRRREHRPQREGLWLERATHIATTKTTIKEISW
ncbi:hypothetical protein VN0965_01630 [Helicobacter pylori]